MSNLRVTTNLNAETTLQLPKTELRSNFLYLYNRGFKEKPFPFMCRMWIGLIAPELTKDPRYGKNARFIRDAMKELHKKMPAGLTRLKKINDNADPHFRVALPIISSATDVFSSRMRTFIRAIADQQVEDHHSEKSNELQSQMMGDKDTNEGNFPPRFYKTNEVLAHMGGLNSAGLEALKACLLGVSLEQLGSRSVWFVHLRISKAEAQQLTNTEWPEIRNVDLYPMMLQWATSSFGQTEGKSPLSSFPISKIARTLPAVTEADIRTDEYGISIAPDGSPLYLPQKLDQTQKYENLFSQAGYNEAEDDFALARDDKMGLVAEGALPRNIPVLIDWVNNKYSFTTTTGMLNVLDLNRYKRADAAHIMSLLSNHRLTGELIGRFIPLARYAGLNISLDPKKEELQDIEGFDPVAHAAIESAIGDINKYTEEVEKAYNRMNGDEIYLTKLTPDSEYQAYRAVYRWCVKAYDAILAQLDSVYAHYSVSHVATQMAWLTIIVKYGAQIPETSAKDMQIRQAALNAKDRKPDPGWEIPSCPLIRKENLILPHQKKIRHLLQDSPDFAILPVQAGGGKSFLAITDVLYEIKANRSQPYLIACPAHLVAQYIKEIVYFTQGKLNAIPINSYSIRRNGLKRLGKMLETAPRNTVVVVDYDVLRYKAQKVCYGTTNVDVYPVIEFLRQFRFGYALLDESHVVKNASARTKACLSLISDIPKKRLASGTMAHDSPSDLAIQIGMLDPTLFGSRDDFNAKYGEKVSGNRVLQWKPGAQQQIMEKLKSRIVVAGAMRKEWAALLPQAEENFHRVDLTEAQREVYNLLFERTMDAIREAAKTSPRLAEFVNGGKKKGGEEGEEGEADPGDESAQDEFEDEDLAAMLNPYLARLEQFITAPAKDELGNTILKGEDRVSAKVSKIHEIMRKHMEKGIQGKVLVFTNYTASAEEIYDTLPPDMKEKAILYIASEKIEAGSAFEHDESKLFMIGVEQSMNTGLNLQFASRLIRVETVWNPGTLEQGNSRVNRPELKAESRRTRIYFDWVMADRTIDITKISRLISKIVANAKFENADNPTYESIPDVPVMKMTLDTVQEHNSWGNPDDPESESTLAVYGNAYAEYRQCLYDDYKEYREKHGELKIERIDEGVTPHDARLMHSVPYTPGLEIYGTDQLGLLRIDEYLRLDDMDSREEEGDEGDDKAEVEDERRRRQMDELIGQVVHTDFGEGVIRSVSFTNRYVRVDLPDGVAKMRFSATFLITRKETSTKDIRNQLLKEVGDLPVDTPIDSPATAIVRDAKSIRIQKEKEEREAEQEKKRKKKELQAQMSIELHVSLINGFLSLSYFIDEENPAASNALQALGFTVGQQFYYAKISNAQRLSKQLALWAENGFMPDPKLKELREAFTSVHTMLQKGKNTPLMNYKFATQGQLRNFYRMEHKPNSDPKLIKPYPLIEDGQAYLVLPAHGQAGTKQAIRFRAPGIKWALSDPVLMYFGLNLNKLVAVAKKITEAGIQVTNQKEINKAYTKLRRLKLRDPSEE